MPFQPINFGPIPTTRMDLARSLMEGLKAGNEPFKIRRKAEEEELANALQKQKLDQGAQQFQSEQALRKAQTGVLQNKSQLPFGGEVAPGAIGQAMWLNMIKQKYGENSPEFADARKSYDSELMTKQALNQYRNALTGSTDKRFSTGLGKEQQELSDVNEGFMPGTGRTQQLTPQEQLAMANQYKLKIQKGVSDTQARQRALFATNIDKTLEGLDPKDLTQYSGVQGGVQLKADQLASSLGKSSESFQKYNKALTLSNLLAKQVRQFYGDSITPQIQEKLGMLTNPSSWVNDPKVALQNFNTFKEILGKETGTYRGALKGTQEFEGDNKSQSGITKLSVGGKSFSIPNNLVDKFKKEHGL